jgi:hypothetical protein
MLTTSVCRNMNRMGVGKETAPSIWLYWLTTKWMAEVRFPLGAGNSIICIPYGPSWRPTWRPTWLRVLGGLSLGIRRPQPESNHASQYSIEVKSVTGIPPHIPSEMFKTCVRACVWVCVLACVRVCHIQDSLVTCYWLDSWHQSCYG